MKTKKQIARLEKIDRLVAEYTSLSQQVSQQGDSRTEMWQKLEGDFGWSRQHMMNILKVVGVLKPKSNVKQKKRRKGNERRVVA
jgi:hypothetical protein